MERKTTPKSILLHADKNYLFQLRSAVLFIQMSQIRVRRDIRALGPAERERFIYCLKMLAVLPPRQANNIRVFNIVWTRDQNFRSYLRPVKPNNIHDEFISSHQTTCEHGAPYFAYYHRHLMICVEIALNYAEEVLLGGKGSVPGDIYSRHPKEFDAVFAKYQDIIARFKKEAKLTGNLPSVAIHYWNPTDYIQNLTIPQEISQRTPDQIDKLYFAVNKHYPWNFNFLTRWFSDLSSVPQGFLNNGYFQSSPAYYTTNERNILLGSLNPRSDYKTFFSPNNNGGGYSTLSDKASDVNLYKNYLKFNQTKSTIDVCTLDQNQLNAIFGNKTKQLHWISQQEKSKMNIAQQTQSYSYNKTLPHFQYAYSLYKSSNTFMKNYVSTFNQVYENSFQNCHNTMHNNLQLFMSDAQVSITNLLFFLYHSWIDLALQTKIRMIRTSDANSNEYSLTQSFLTNVKPRSVLDQPSGPPGNITYADYYIFEWAKPDVRFNSNLVLTPKDYQVAFKGKRFVVNEDKKGIRRSDQLDQFYKKEYLPSNGAKYSYFKGFSNFNFNYNFEILDYDKNGAKALKLMQGNVVPVPSYIEAIYKDYDSVWNANKTKALANQVQSLQSMPMLMGPVSSEDLNKNNFSSVEKYYDKKYLLRAVRAAFQGYGTYSSDRKSLNVAIILNLTQKGKKQLQIKKQYKELIGNGLLISSISLFSRGMGSSICPNCKEGKQIWISCSQSLAEMNEELFCALSSSINRQLIYQYVDEKQTPVDNIKLSELMSLRPQKPVLTSLKLLEGAKEIHFKVSFVGKEDFKTSSIKIAGYSYGIIDDKLSNIVFCKKENLNCEVQLAKVMSAYGTTSQESYVYRRIKVHITNGAEYHEFSFEINTYHDMIRYNIEIVQKVNGDKSYLNVSVKDRDFKFKQRHYSINEYEI